MFSIAEPFIQALFHSFIGVKTPYYYDKVYQVCGEEYNIETAVTDGSIIQY